MKDSWCRPLHRRGNTTLYGGAARNFRISCFGWHGHYFARFAQNAAREALESADIPVGSNIVSIQRKNPTAKEAWKSVSPLGSSNQTHRPLLAVFCLLRPAENGP